MGFDFITHQSRLLKKQNQGLENEFISSLPYWILVRLGKSILTYAISSRIQFVIEINSFSGIHTYKKICNVDKEMDSIRARLKHYSKLMFPKQLTIIKGKTNLPNKKKENGGWGDIRDIKLCQQISTKSAND